MGLLFGPLTLSNLATVICLCFDWLAWFVMLGGLAAFTAKCGTWDSNGVSVNGSLGDSCTNLDALNWWAVSFMLVVLMLLTYTKVKTCGPSMERGTTLLLVLATGLFMVTANTNRALISGLSSAQSSFSNAVLDNACNQLYSDACAGYESALSDMKAARNGQQALLAGTIITLCANMALIFLRSGEEGGAPASAAHLPTVQKSGASATLQVTSRRPSATSIQPGSLRSSFTSQQKRPASMTGPRPQPAAPGVQESAASITLKDNSVATLKENPLAQAPSPDNV